MTCSRNDVILIPIPFSDLSSRKVRPAVVIGSRGSDLFLVPNSSQIFNTDFQLINWSFAGLNVPCGIKAQITTVANRLALKRVGTLSATDAIKLDQQLKHWLSL